MSFQKKPSDHFQTFRLFGKHAQKILDTARERMRSTRKSEEAALQQSFSTSEMEEPNMMVTLSLGGVVRATVAILVILTAGYLCYLLRDKILLLLLGIFIAVVIDPGVTFLESFRIPRGFAIFLVYVFAISLLLFLLASLIPIIAEQIQQMAVWLGGRIDQFLADPTFSVSFLSHDVNVYLNAFLRQILADISTGGTLQTLQQFGQRLSGAAQGSLVFVVGVAGSVLQFIVQLVFVLVLAFFLELEKEGVVR